MDLKTAMNDLLHELVGCKKKLIKAENQEMYIEYIILDTNEKCGLLATDTGNDSLRRYRVKLFKKIEALTGKRPQTWKRIKTSNKSLYASADRNETVIWDLKDASDIWNNPYFDNESDESDADPLYG